MKIALTLTCIALGTAAFAMVLLYVGQHRVLYPAPRTALPATLPDHVSRVDLTSGYALLLRASPDPLDDQPLIIFTHGNGETAWHWINAFGPLLNEGFAVLLVEYPGYGGAPGQPSLSSIEQTVLSAYDQALLLPGIDAQNVVGYGRSIGGGAIALLASQRPLAGLVLESTFASLPQLIKEKGLPPFLLKDRYDNVGLLRKLALPVLLYHGSEDTLIPLHHSKALEAALPDAQLIVRRCGHNDCERPWPELLRFLNGKVLVHR
ncbi:MAG: alpha/beta hydrolase [Pseudomonadota bacterium]